MAASGLEVGGASSSSSMPSRADSHIYSLENGVRACECTWEHVRALVALVCSMAIEKRR